MIQNALRIRIVLSAIGAVCTGFGTWTDNYINIKLWCLNTYPYTHSNGTHTYIYIKFCFAMFVLMIMSSSSRFAWYICQYSSRLLDSTWSQSSDSKLIPELVGTISTKPQQNTTNANRDLNSWDALWALTIASKPYLIDCKVSLLYVSYNIHWIKQWKLILCL